MPLISRSAPLERSSHPIQFYADHEILLSRHGLEPRQRGVGMDGHAPPELQNILSIFTAGLPHSG